MAVPFENRNFHKEMLKLAGQLQKEGKVPRLLLHSCCAPCSSNCIEVLSKYFMVTVFYYNPNISSDEEYKKRVAEQIRFIKEFDTPNKVEFIEGDYEPDVFFKEDSVVIYAYNEHNELVRVFVYPDERILHSIQNVVEKDVFKVIDF